MGLVRVVNRLAGGAFDLLLAPFRSFDPLVGLAVVSLITAAAMLLAFRRLSNQPRLAAVKRQIHACVFECRLFQDDLLAVFRAQRELVRRNVTYLGLSLVPMVWLSVPLVLVLAQLDTFFGYQGGAPGQTLLVTATLRAAPGGVPGSPAASLTVPSGVRVSTPAVWVPSTGEVIWRVEPERPGTYEVGVEVGGRTVTKQLEASGGMARRSPHRAGPGWLDQLRYPSEPPIEDGAPVSSVTIDYAPRQVGMLGWYVPWFVPYSVMVIAASFLLRRWLKVTI